MYTNFNL